MDFVANQLSVGRRIRTLTTIHPFTQGVWLLRLEAAFQRAMSSPP